MVEMKDAVKNAIGFIEEFYPGAKDIRLEEVGPDRLKGLAAWSVVISFKTGESGTLSEVMGRDFRLYKDVEIEADTGTPRALRNWQE